MYCLYPTNTTFRRLFSVIYHCTQKHNIAPIWCKSQDGWKPVQPAAIRCRIQVLYNVQVICYASHFDSKLTIYSSGLSTSFRYLLALDFPFLFVIIISSPPVQQIMAPQTPQQGERGTEWSRTTGASSNTPPSETQLQCRHHVAHRNPTNGATDNMTLDAQLKIARKTGSSQNKGQHVIGCEYSRIEVAGCQLMLYRAAGVRRELRDQFLAARNGKPPWSNTAFVRTVHEIEIMKMSALGFSRTNWVIRIAQSTPNRLWQGQRMLRKRVWYRF